MNNLKNNTYSYKDLTINNVDKLESVAGRLRKIPPKIFGRFKLEKQINQIRRFSESPDFKNRKIAYFSILDGCKISIPGESTNENVIKEQEPYLYSNTENFPVLNNVFGFLCNIISLNSSEENKECYFIKNLTGFVLAHLFIFTNQGNKSGLTIFLDESKGNIIDFNKVSDFINNEILKQEREVTINFAGEKFLLQSESEWATIAAGHDKTIKSGYFERINSAGTFEVIDNSNNF